MLFRNLYAIPGLDYVAHEDILPYKTSETNPLQVSNTPEDIYGGVFLGQHFILTIEELTRFAYVI